MKNIFLLLALMAGLKSFAQTTPLMNPNIGVMTFKEEKWDFGNIPQGKPVTHTFVFTNTGKEPIVISSGMAGCNCTTVTWTKEPIKPGSTGEITGYYDAANEGRFDKTFIIFSNSSTADKVLFIKGVVQPKPKN